MRRVYGRKVVRLTLGGLPFCSLLPIMGELPASRGVGTVRQKSAEAIVGGRTSR